MKDYRKLELPRILLFPLYPFWIIEIAWIKGWYYLLALKKGKK